MSRCGIKGQGSDGTETGWGGGVDLGGGGDAAAPRTGAVRRHDRGLVPPALGPAPQPDDHPPKGAGRAALSELLRCLAVGVDAGQPTAWVSQGRWAHSTVRNYQGSLALFLAYICDPRYGWSEHAWSGWARPDQICHEWNSAAHVAEYEGRPGRRPFTRAELQALFDTADAAVEEAAGSPRKGWLAAFRDATLIKVTYGWGLRCREAAMLDVADFGPNPAAPELGGYGICHVRFGKAMRGSPPRRRAVASVMPWAVEALAQYVGEVRPLHGQAARGPALWLTERGERISPRRIDERFAQWRRRAGLPAELSVHCLRHSYIICRPLSLSATTTFAA